VEKEHFRNLILRLSNSPRGTPSPEGRIHVRLLALGAVMGPMVAESAVRFDWEDGIHEVMEEGNR